MRSGFSLELTGQANGLAVESRHKRDLAVGKVQVWGSISGRVSGLSVMSKAQHLRFKARQVSGVTPPPATCPPSRAQASRAGGIKDQVILF